jgi:hypothetical protein
MLEKARSIAYITSEKISEATSTTTRLLCNSSHVGQLTLCKSSLLDSFIYNLILFMSLSAARVERLELPAYGFGDHRSAN